MHSERTMSAEERPWRRTAGRSAALVGLVGLLGSGPVSAAESPVGDPDRGRVLAAVGSCGACHTLSAREGAYAGGYAIETPQGTFFGPNLTPHPTAGLGAWDFSDFKRAMVKGRSPSGQRYWPAFPYPSYTRLSEQDLADLWAYLQTLPASPRANTPHDLGGRTRFPAMLLWRALYFRAGPLRADPTQTETWNRGAVLGKGIGHCGECHTPRNRFGAPSRGAPLSGHSQPPEPAPDISQRRLSDWSLSDTVSFFEDGMTPNGDIVGGEMARIVETGTAHLLPAEREALAEWLLSIGTPPENRPAETVEKELWE